MSTITYQQKLVSVAETTLSIHLRLLENPSQALHFLHGNGFAVRSYDALLEGIAELEDLMLQDAAGHGLSPAGDRFAGWEESSYRFYRALIEQKQIQQWKDLVGVGHSFGGCMTLLMNHRDPQLFKQMVLLDPAWYPPEMIAQLNDMNEQDKRSKLLLVRQTERRRTLWRDTPEVLSRLRGRGTFVGWQDRCLQDYVTYSTHENKEGFRQLNCPPWLEAAVFGSSPSMLWQAIAQLETPTYVIWGTDTHEMFQASYRLAQTMNSNLRFIEVQGDHCFMMQQPEQTARLVRAVIDHNGETIDALKRSGFVLRCDDLPPHWLS